MLNLRTSIFRWGILFILFFVHWSFPYGISSCLASEALYESQLDKGLFNTEPYSYLLIERAHADRTMAKALLDQAKRYSPDLPAVYFELARESFSPSAHGIFQGLDYFRQGIEAYARDFWWGFSIAGMAYISLIISFALSLLFILAIRLPAEAGLILHDGAEDKRKLLFLAVPILLSLSGPIALIAGMFFWVGFYFKKENKIVAYAALLFFLLSPFLLRGVDTFLSSSPALKAIVAVNEGKDNRYALRTLKGKKDFGSRFSYALALKREGSYQEAIDAYRMLSAFPYRPDPRVYINLGNSYYGLQDIDAARDAYRKSIETTPLPSAFYNLSQIHREMFDFAKGDEYFLEAAKINPIAVSRFSSVSSRNPNRFVVDETLPISIIWKYALGGLFGTDLEESRGFLPDLPILPITAGLVMIPGFFLLNKKVRYRALRCKRCGSTFCSRCSRVIAWGEMCPRCYGSLIKIDEIDSRERVTRLLSIYHSQAKRRKMTKLLSYLMPGAGQIYAGKILAGWLFLWPFLFSSTLLVMNNFPSAGIAPFSHDWIAPLMILFMVLAYMSSVINVRRRIHKGWL